MDDIWLQHGIALRQTDGNIYTWTLKLEHAMKDDILSQGSSKWTKGSSLTRCPVSQLHCSRSEFQSTAQRFSLCNLQKQTQDLTASKHRHKLINFWPETHSRRGRKANVVCFYITAEQHDHQIEGSTECGKNMVVARTQLIPCTLYWTHLLTDKEWGLCKHRVAQYTGYNCCTLHVHPFEYHQ